MTIFNRIGAFFTSLFGSVGKYLQEILSDASKLINLAQPIVAELAILSSAAPDQTTLIKEISKWLSTYESDASKVASWVASTSGMTTAQILQSAATTAVSAVAGTGAAASVLNFAVEAAYQIYQKLQAAKASTVQVPPVTTP
jgi:flavorubredoxin